MGSSDSDIENRKTKRTVKPPVHFERCLFTEEYKINVEFRDRNHRDNGMLVSANGGVCKWMFGFPLKATTQFLVFV